MNSDAEGTGASQTQPAQIVRKHGQRCDIDAQGPYNTPEYKPTHMAVPSLPMDAERQNG
jgi:hypothetical protein